MELRNGQLQVVHALDDPNGITFEGARLRVTAYADLPDQSVTVQLEFQQDGRRDSAIDRIDWRPLHTHGNGNVGPDHCRLRTIVGTHRHEFSLNWLSDLGRLRTGNLPIAVPVNPDPPDLRSLLEFAEACFRVGGLVTIGPPPWESTLFPRTTDDSN